MPADPAALVERLRNELAQTCECEGCHARRRHLLADVVDEVARLAQENERLTLERDEHHGCAMALELIADDFRQERDHARAALRMVEWADGHGQCLWCNRHCSVGHAPDCPRQAALGASGEERCCE